MNDNPAPPQEPARSGFRIPTDTLLLYALMLACASSATLIGTILLHLTAEFSIPLAKGGLFYSVQSTGCFLGILLSGYLIDAVHPRRLNLFTHGALTLFLLAIGLSRGLGPYLVILFVLGISTKVLDAGLNAFVAQKHAVNTGFYMNLLHACFGVGSFLGPLVAGFCLEWADSWRLAYLVLAAFCLVLLVAYWRIPAKGEDAAATPPPENAAATWRSVLNARTLLLWLVLFFYGGHQMGMNGWVPAYMQETFAADTISSGFALSCYWLGLIVCRVVCSLLTQKYGETLLLNLGLAVGSIVLAAGVYLNREWSAYAACAGSGLLTGATIPIVLTIAYGWYPWARGKITMLLYIAITGSQIVLPWLLGVIGDAYGLPAAMIGNGALLGLACVSGLGLFKKSTE